MGTPRLLSLLALTVALASCGSNSDPDAGDSATTTAAVATTAAPVSSTTVDSAPEVAETTAPASTEPTTPPSDAAEPSTESSAEFSSESSEASDEQASSLTLLSAGDQTQTVMLRTLPAVGDSWTGTQIVDSQISIDAAGAPPSQK